jgi:chromosome segregation ATPase
VVVCGYIESAVRDVASHLEEGKRTLKKIHEKLSDMASTLTNADMTDIRDALSPLEAIDDKLSDIQSDLGDIKSDVDAVRQDAVRVEADNPSDHRLTQISTQLAKIDTELGALLEAADSRIDYSLSQISGQVGKIDTKLGALLELRGNQLATEANDSDSA